MTPETKPGWKTTEFWLALAPWLVFGVSTTATALVESGLLGEGSFEMRVALLVLTVAGAIGSALSAAGYSVARGMTKAGEMDLQAVRESIDSDERIARLDFIAKSDSQRPTPPTTTYN